MGFTGVFVMARPPRTMTEQDGVGAFGAHPLFLRDLHDGWQLLQLVPGFAPPDLRAACRALADSTRRPVFAAHVFHSDCAVYATAFPGETGDLRHLWTVTNPNHHYRHVPRGTPEPARSTLFAVVDELCSWSAASGLKAGPKRLFQVIGASPGLAENGVIELIKALGVSAISRVRPWSFTIDSEPFAMVADPWNGLGARALIMKAEGRPPEPWWAPAITLTGDIYTALHRPDADVSALLRRIAEVKKLAMDGPPGRETAHLRTLYPDPVNWAPGTPRIEHGMRVRANRWATTDD